MRHLISVMTQILESLEALRLEFNRTEFRNWLSDLMPAERESALNLCKQLFIQRVEVLRSFELLAGLDIVAAKSQLLQRYLGAINPDRKFGGYENELESLLEDVVALHGEPSLRALVLESDFDRIKLGDDRVVRSFCEALSLESVSDFCEWLAGAGIAPSEWEIIRLLNIGRTAGELGDVGIAMQCLSKARELCATMALPREHRYMRFLRFYLYRFDLDDLLDEDEDSEDPAEDPARE